MGFAQSFLAGRQLSKAKEEDKYKALQMIMGRKKTWPSGGALRMGGGGKPYVGEEQEETSYVWEEQAEEEHRAEMRAAETQMAEEAVKRARIQNRALAPVTGPRGELYDEAAQAALESAAIYGELEESYRAAPRKEAQEYAERGLLDKAKREEGRQEHITGYVNRDPEQAQSGWSKMFPGSQFEAQFDVDPGGNMWIQLPGSPEKELYDESMFSNFGLFGSAQFEQPVTTPAGRKVPASVAARAGKTSKGMSVKDYLAYEQKERKGKIDMYEFARKFAEGQAETTDEFGTKTIDRDIYDKAWDKAVNLFQKTPSKAYGAGVPKPKTNVSISQGKKLIKRAVDEYNDFKAKDQVVEPKIMFNKLLEEYGPRVAFGFMDGIKEDVFAERQPRLGPTGLRPGGFDVRTTGEFAGTQPSPPSPPAAPIPPAPGFGGPAPGPGAGISPTPVPQTPDFGPMQNAPKTVQLPNTGDSLQISPYDARIMITDAMGQPKEVTQAHIDDLILQARAAPIEQRSFFGAIFDWIRRDLRRAARQGRPVPQTGGRSPMAGLRM